MQTEGTRARKAGRRKRNKSRHNEKTTRVDDEVEHAAEGIFDRLDDYEQEERQGSNDYRDDNDEEGPPKKGATVGVYGFVLWLCTFICYFLYLLWAFLPEDWLHSIGMTYYPKKYWAIAVPAYFCFSFWAIYFVYWGFGFLYNAPLDSKESIRDEYSGIYVGPPTGDETDVAPAVVYDIPIDVVSRLLYLEQREDKAVVQSDEGQPSGMNRRQKRIKEKEREE